VVKCTVPFAGECMTTVGPILDHAGADGGLRCCVCRRYWLLGLSIRLQMIWRWCGAFLAAAAATLAERLDYAHCHRHAYAAAVA
jgi:hypothetical protein